MRFTSFVCLLALIALAACKDQGPPGPNLVIINESAPNAADLTLTDTLGAPVYTATIAIGERVCASLDARQLVDGTADIGVKTIPVAPFWASELNNWTDVFIFRDTLLVHTHQARDSCYR